MKLNRKFLLGLFTIIVAGMVVFGSADLNPAFADTVNDAWNKAGITTGKSIDSSGLFDDLNKIIYLVIAIGAMWVVFCIVIGSMLLSSSMGNPQRRTMGIIAILCSAAGGWVMYKAYDIAGWVASIGGA